MTLTLDLTPEQENRLQAEAAQRGLPVTEYAVRLLTGELLLKKPAESEGVGLVNLLQAWIEEDATDDPEEIRAAEKELAAFKQAMNKNRAINGEEPIYR